MVTATILVVVGGTLFDHRTIHKVHNPVDRFVISNRFKICLLDVRNQRAAYIDLERDHHLMDTCLRLCLAFGVPYGV